MKAKVYSLKIGPMILSFRRKLNESKSGPTKQDLIAADKYQAGYFGYKPLGVSRYLMSRERIAKYLEVTFSAQDEKSKASFYKAMLRQGKHREKLMKSVVEVKK